MHRSCARAVYPVSAVCPFVGRRRRFSVVSNRSVARISSRCEFFSFFFYFLGFLLIFFIYFRLTRTSHVYFFIPQDSTRFGISIRSENSKTSTIYLSVAFDVYHRIKSASTSLSRRTGGCFHFPRCTTTIRALRYRCCAIDTPHA